MNQEPVPHCPIHQKGIPPVPCSNLQQEGVMAERKKQSKALLHGKKDDYNATVLVVMSVK